MQGGPVDELLNVAVQGPALDQLEVEVERRRALISAAMRDASAGEGLGEPRPLLMKRANSSSFITNNLRDAEDWPQPIQRPLCSGLSHARRNGERPSDLFEGQVQVEAENDHDAVVVAQPAEGAADLVTSIHPVLRWRGRTALDKRLEDYSPPGAPERLATLVRDNRQVPRFEVGAASKVWIFAQALRVASCTASSA